MTTLPMAWMLSALLASPFPQVPDAREPAWEGALRPEERTELSRQTKIDGRIRVYSKASVRLAGRMERLVSEEKFSEVREELRLWAALIVRSAEDIVVSVPVGKRPKPVIRYEIQLRKLIAQMQSLRVKATVEAFDAFVEWAASAENSRKSIMEVIFPKP